MPRATVSFLATAASALVFAAPIRAETVSLKSSGGTLLVPVVINHQMALDFMLDSGASDVSIPMDVFSTLVRTGTVNESDYLGTQVYELANGAQTRSHRFRIRSLQVGGLELRDVVASVAPAAGTLLLGQSFLGRLGSWTIDNRRHLLVINELGTAQSEPAAENLPSTTSGTVIQAGINDRSADDWYQCMKRNGWRDGAEDLCSKSSDIRQPVATYQSATDASSTDAWYKCMKGHEWRDDARALCSKAGSATPGSATPFTPDEETRQWLLRPRN